MSVKREVAVGAFILISFLSGCGGETSDQKAPADTAGQAGIARADSMGMGAMGGMGMGAMPMGSMQMDSEMMAHMQRMSGDSAVPMMAEHGRMLGDMMTRMSHDLDSLNVKPDSSWTVLMDSLRTDMSQMSRLSATEMQAFMLKHRARVMRMMNMHRTMIEGGAR